MKPVILIHYHEIALKGKNRPFFERKLLQNIKKALKGRVNPNAVKREYGRLVIQLKADKAGGEQFAKEIGKREHDFVANASLKGGEHFAKEIGKRERDFVANASPKEGEQFAKEIGKRERDFVANASSLSMKKLWPGFLVLILSWFAVVPLFQPGFFSMHDDTQVARVFEMTKVLRDGHFPVRFVQDLGYGYGYPLFNFYAPLPYYFSAFLTLLGINVLTATKLMFLVGILLSGFFMYCWISQKWGKFAGLISSVIYVWTPYRFLDVYVRGSLGEATAFIFPPLILCLFFILHSLLLASFSLISLSVIFPFSV